MTKHDFIIVLLDGEADSAPWILDIAKYAYIIAADGGIRHADLLGVEPHLWVGDFDSANEEVRKRYKNVQRKKYPSQKAKSDGEIAIEEALTHKPQKLVLVGALGGQRTDHGFFNVLGALRFAHKHPGIEFILTGANQIALPLLPGTPVKIAKNLGTTLSVIPFSKLSGLSIDGVHWPLKSVEVELGSTHTLSNRLVSDAEIRIADGLAIAILQTDD